MRTTLNLDDDVMAILEHERRRTGQTLGQVAGLFIRRGALAPPRHSVTLPTLPGGPIIDISDVSAVLAELDDERDGEVAVRQADTSA
ncbi:MAG: hypothetical protein ACFCVG_07305 [Kineosporiaceae bacterium]